MLRNNPASILMLVSLLSVGVGMGISAMLGVSRAPLADVHKVNFEELVAPKDFDTVVIGAEALDWPRFRRFLDDCLESYEE